MRSVSNLENGLLSLILRNALFFTSADYAAEEVPVCKELLIRVSILSDTCWHHNDKS